MTDVSTPRVPRQERSLAHAARVLVVHQHAAVGEALARRLAREGHLDVVGAVSRPQRVMALVPARSVGTVVLDWDLDGDAADELTSRLHALDDPPVIVALGSAETSPSQVVQALRAGARAWVAQEGSVDLLLEALRHTARGEMWLPGDRLGRVVADLLATRQEPDPGPLDALTPRELDVLRCMMAGLGQNDIAARLYLSPNTIRTHRRRTLAKLSVHTSLEAVFLARRAGLQAADPPSR